LSWPSRRPTGKVWNDIAIVADVDAAEAGRSAEPWSSRAPSRSALHPTRQAM
jgi:hypothetical protein